MGNLRISLATALIAAISGFLVSRIIPISNLFLALWGLGTLVVNGLIAAFLAREKGSRGRPVALAVVASAIVFVCVAHYARYLGFTWHAS